MKTNIDARKFPWAALATFALACLLALAPASVAPRVVAREAFDADAGAESSATREGRLRIFDEVWEQVRERFRPAPAEEAEALIDLSTDEGAQAHKDLREPAPYRRLRPAYPDTASRAEAEATVDAAVEIGADGEVGRVEIVRWAGFGLDDSVVSTIRQMHFRPATRDGEAVAVRVLLRYNFRKPTTPK